ncbi:sensor histidine kinase [Winogradskyella sp. PG-2]|uniref:sensor histidine kinase n=1 Tax=Winogradskyella sp. PG-2 TaxID=754409 RepID=UPI00045870EF|nr:ATP-binding protein [Winogradskyella sp. PG-2]BAO74980.1 two-component system sensor histidine kinase [Winogradskyella sp. PG-2]
MNDKKYKWILYTIVAVIIATIGIQFFWNYKNYQTNKQQLINEVQISLDKAVDDYYASLAERTTMGIFLEGDNQKDVFVEGGKIETFLTQIDTLKNEFKNLDSLPIQDIEGITVVRGLKLDSMLEEHDKIHPSVSPETFKLKIDSIKNQNKDLDIDDFEMLTSKIVISITNDSLNLKEIDSLLKGEFDRKKITVDYELYYDKGKQNRKFSKDFLKPVSDSIFNTDDILKTTSKSTFLPKKSTLEIGFTNETKVILQRILGGVLISTLLVIAVISCLFYLLKIIKYQKQLAEVKNDLISNITHEFKTPIATIGVALESINNFNAIEDKTKTREYINMSSEQLGKLNTMVEKLLETATLDSDNLELNKESIDIIELFNSLINRYKIQFPEKEFNTSFKVENLLANVDIFHFENALNNILDNAVKYGGDIISLDLIPTDKKLNILISDNGNSLSKTNKERIFEKFYRVPKGNTHDVKGFGIGLYYTKTIIEKHNGSIGLDLAKNLTTFKISLPNV